MKKKKKKREGLDHCFVAAVVLALMVVRGLCDYWKLVPSSLKSLEKAAESMERCFLRFIHSGMGCSAAGAGAGAGGLSGSSLAASLASS